MAEKIDTGVPIDEMLTNAEVNRAKFERWLRRDQDLANRQIPGEPKPANGPAIPLPGRRPATQLQMRGGKK